jgi:hypothetical protein
LTTTFTPSKTLSAVFTLSIRANPQIPPLAQNRKSLDGESELRRLFVRHVTLNFTKKTLVLRAPLPVRDMLRRDTKWR